jgi:hypothetical protein
MARARDIANIINSGTFITPASASTTFLTQTSASTIYQGAPNRNLIINGAMQVAQRSASVASITVGEYYTADRWLFDLNSFGTWTQTLENDAPTGSGFRKSIKLLCTTADASPAANDYLTFQQRFEGQNLQQILKGTSSAKELTLSFWVKSNVVGTYVMELFDADNNRQVSATYTINSSATWEKKIITFPADTTGAFDNDNAFSLTSQFWLGAGSTFTSGTLNTSWASTVTANRAVGQTNLAAATNNYWQITGVQLEVGAVATPFEFKPYEQDLRECQRYYLQSENSGIASHGYEDWSGFIDSGYTSNCFVNYRFPVEMRISPNITVYSGNGNGWVDSHGRGQVGNGGVLVGGISRRGFQQIYHPSLSLGSSGQALRGGYRANAEL